MPRSGSTGRLPPTARGPLTGPVARIVAMIERLWCRLRNHETQRDRESAQRSVTSVSRV